MATTSSHHRVMCTPTYEDRLLFRSALRSMWLVARREVVGGRLRCERLPKGDDCLSPWAATNRVADMPPSPPGYD